jgi:phospholipid/cholesterol/gamma-HCH transport system substrate-binding protein
VLGEDVKPLARDLAALAATLNARLPPLVDKVERLTDTLNAAAADARALVGPENRAKVETLIGNLDRTSATLAALSGKLDRVATTLDGVVADNRVTIDRSLADLRHVMRSLSRNIDAITQNLDGTSRNMYEFSRQIRQNPGLLLGGTPPADAARAR